VPRAATCRRSTARSASSSSSGRCVESWGSSPHRSPTHGWLWPRIYRGILRCARIGCRAYCRVRLRARSVARLVFPGISTPSLRDSVSDAGQRSRRDCEAERTDAGKADRPECLTRVAPFRTDRCGTDALAGPRRRELTGPLPGHDRCRVLVEACAFRDRARVRPRGSRGRRAAGADAGRGKRGRAAGGAGWNSGSPVPVAGSPRVPITRRRIGTAGVDRAPDGAAPVQVGADARR
jgi:hypothetical protein